MVPGYTLTQLAGRRKRLPLHRPPAAVGHPIAPCGMVLTASGIASPSRRFCGLPLPPQPVRCIYKSPASLPRTTTHFSLPFSLSCPPRPVHCPLLKMPPYPTTALFQYGALHSPLFDHPPFSFQLRRHRRVIWTASSEIEPFHP